MKTTTVANIHPDNPNDTIQTETLACSPRGLIAVRGYKAPGEEQVTRGVWRIIHTQTGLAILPALTITKRNAIKLATEIENAGDMHAPNTWDYLGHGFDCSPARMLKGAKKAGKDFLAHTQGQAKGVIAPFRARLMNDYFEGFTMADLRTRERYRENKAAKAKTVADNAEFDRPKYLVKNCPRGGASSDFISVVPNHGRDYRGTAKIAEGIAAGQDFIVSNIHDSADGKPVNAADCIAAGKGLRVRYNRATRVAFFTVAELKGGAV